MTMAGPRKKLSDKSPGVPLDRSWHLARSAGEVDATEFEFALMRTYEAFGRWQGACLADVIDLEVSGPETALLHVIRMNERPKRIKELARLTNRDDIPNIQYSLRKLAAAGLIERSGSGRTGVTYQVTRRGQEVTESYARIRQSLLIAALESAPGLRRRLADATQLLDLIAGIYDQIARTATTHRRP